MKNDKVKNIFIIIIFIVILIVIAFLLFVYPSINDANNYMDDVIFRLNDSQFINIEVGKEWKDPLVTAIYNGESIASQVIVNGNVNTNIPGQYEITYTIRKGKSVKTLKRLVIVYERNIEFNLELKGEETIYILKGDVYTEPGYNAYYDGVDISNEVVVTGSVNTNVSGEYTLIYKVNKNNTFREKKRKVIVSNFNYQFVLQDNNSYVRGNTIIFSTSDNNYDYLLMPDGQKNYNKNISYKIEMNGTYNFVVYSKLGYSEKKTFNITNIDKTAPTGSCVGYIYDTYTELSVSASDDVGISGYEYYYDGKKSGKVSNTKFQISDMVNVASVIIYDKLNNMVNVNCSMIDKTTTTPRSYNSYTFTDPDTSRTMNYWLYIPKNVTKRNPAPLMIYLHGDGSRGNDVRLVNKYAYPKFINEGTDYPFMMVAPQINNETNWTSERTYKRLMNLVNYIIANYNVNTKKIILVGGSSGGGGAYVITANYPRFFSCTVVGSGIYDSVYRNFANNLIYTPMWIFHGTNDHIDYNSVKNYADYINSLGGNVKFVGIPGGTHGVTETVQGFNNPELINWMVSQERK